MKSEIAPPEIRSLEFAASPHERRGRKSVAVVDIYHHDDVYMPTLAADGIVAVIHKATEGVTYQDPFYKARREQARDAGLLWGAYHFARKESWQGQVENFIRSAEPNEDTLIAWDWEVPPVGGSMTLADLRCAVQMLYDRLGRWPVLYSGHLLREQIGNDNDPILRNCPLWYARYACWPSGIPMNTWSSYSLWQYTAAEIPNPCSSPPGPLDAAGTPIDRNMFNGTLDELREQWPLIGDINGNGADSREILLADKPASVFPDRLLPAEETQEKDRSTYPEPDTEPGAAELALDRLLDDRTSESLSFESRAASSTYWPQDDTKSPDYAHLVDSSTPLQPSFALQAGDLDLLISANRFEPVGTANVFAFALRGAELISGHDAEQQQQIKIRDVRPDHVNFRCLVGFYYQSAKAITLYSASTVPAPYYMQQYFNRKNGLPYTYSGGCNLLPTGCYAYRVDRHRDLRPALRASNRNNVPEDATMTILRTENDLTYETRDIWDPTKPYDNVHCSYYLNVSPTRGARFSSAGCITIRGRKDPSHQWAKFQRVLSNSIGNSNRCDLLLLTGTEASIAVSLRERGQNNDHPIVRKELERLRSGSQGDAVRRLQQHLGISEDGDFGPRTRKTLTAYQQQEGLAVTAIYTPALDEMLGWAVFD